MSTGRSLISSIRGMHRLLSTDSSITDRVILSELKFNTFLLVKREVNLRRLWATDTIFTTIPCLQMKNVPISECCNYVDNCEVSRSCYPLPRIAEGIYQYTIQGVYSINAMGGKGKKLTEITVNRYINLLKLRIVKNDTYFWILNGYLYVSKPLIKAVRISAMFEEDIPDEVMYPDCDCKPIKNPCENPLDRQLPLPGYLEKQVIDLTSQKLLSTYFGIKQDLANEGIDSQSPNVK